VSLPDVVAVALFLGVVAYAVLGGADFGSGFFDLTAGSARGGAAIRTQVDHSIGPVWEANHVWLIYVLVTAWTAFPEAFAAAMTTLILPLLLALLGIVLRGASFAFRKNAPSLGLARFFGATFAVSSVVTPFFFGAVAGSIASGRVPAEGYGDVFGSWINPTSLVCGVVAVGTCAFLAGTFLTADATRAGDVRLADALRLRTLAVGLVTGAVVLAALVPLYHDSETLFAGLTGRALPVVVVSSAAGLATVVLLAVRRAALARLTAVLAVAGLVVAWGVAQYPWLLTDEITIADAAGATATLEGLLVALGVAAVTVGPALAFLFRLTQSEAWTRTDAH
jgi:cytochrome bd ubiquinol oxidase subunit II